MTTKQDDSYQYFEVFAYTHVEGQYVAIVGRSIVANRKNGDRAYEIAQKKFPTQKKIVIEPAK